MTRQAATDTRNFDGRHDVDRLGPCEQVDVEVRGRSHRSGVVSDSSHPARHAHMAHIGYIGPLTRRCRIVPVTPQGVEKQGAKIE